MLVEILLALKTMEAQQNIPTGLLTAMCRTESSLRPYVKNPSDGVGGRTSIGLCQIQIPTAQQYCKLTTEEQLKNFKLNANCASIILKKHYTRYSSWCGALIAYNKGHWKGGWGNKYTNKVEAFYGKDLCNQEARSQMKSSNVQQLISELQTAPTRVDQTGGRIFKSRTEEQRIKAYEDSRLVRAKMLSNKVPFITYNFLEEFYLCQGAILVGAQSGRGKSSIAANIVAGILKEKPGSKIMFVSNEENTDAILERVGCCLTGINYLKAHKRTLSEGLQKILRDAVMSKVIPYLEVVSQEELDTTSMEDLISIMETAAAEGVSAIVIDYHQNVNASKDDLKKESFRVSKEIGEYYRDYGSRHGIPVIVLVQMSNRQESSGFKDRVENDKTLINHAFLAIEAIPNFEARTTKFIIHKDRYNGHTGKTVTMEFDGGAFRMVDEMRPALPNFNPSEGGTL